MKHYVYKLVHIETGEFYYGSRSCKCEIEEDDYMGSMKVWKPNKDNLIKTIIKSNFKTRDDANSFEYKIISENIYHELNRNFHNNQRFCNYGTHHDFETKTRISNSMKGKHVGKKNPFYGKTHSEETKFKISALGRTHSDNTKQQMSDSAKQIDRSDYNLKRKSVLHIPTNQIFKSMYEASKVLGVSRNRIRRHINNILSIPQEFKLL